MPQYICDECGKTFSGNRWIKKYKHTFCCQECDRKWKRKERYYNVMVMIDEPSGRRSY